MAGNLDFNVSGNAITYDGTNYAPTSQTTLEVSNWYSIETMTGVPLEEFPAYHLEGWGKKGDARTLTIQGETIIVVDLQRRVFDPRKAVKDVSDAMTAISNDGRIEEASRYNQTINLYKQVLSQTNLYLNALIAAFDAFQADVLPNITSLQTISDSYQTLASADLSEYGNSRRQAINQQYDNEKSKSAQQLMDRGMYNTFSLESAYATIEEARTRALNEFEDSFRLRTSQRRDEIYEKNVSALKVLINEKSALYKIMHENHVELVSLRNRLVDTLAEMAKSRVTDYPSISDISNTVATIGQAKLTALSTESGS